MSLPAVDLLGRTWDSIDALCADLTEEDWKTPTACEGWSVQDQVSHLIDYEAGALGRLRPDHTVGELPHLKNPMGQANEVGVDYRRRFSGAEVLAEFREVMAERRAQLGKLTDEDLVTEVQTPVGKGTLADMLQLRLMDTWSHEQDIRRAVGRPGHVEGPAVDGALTYFFKLVPFVVGKRAGAPEGASVVFDVGNRIVPVQVIDGRAALVETEPSSPTTRLTMDAATFAALVGGRTASADGVTIDGDHDLADRVLSNLALMP